MQPHNADSNTAMQIGHKPQFTGTLVDLGVREALMQQAAVAEVPWEAGAGVWAQARALLPGNIAQPASQHPSTAAVASACQDIAVQCTGGSCTAALLAGEEAGEAGRPRAIGDSYADSACEGRHDCAAASQDEA